MQKENEKAHGYGLLPLRVLPQPEGPELADAPSGKNWWDARGLGGR